MLFVISLKKGVIFLEQLARITGNMEYLDFEKPIQELEAQVSELETKTHETNIDLSDQITDLKNKISELIQDTYSSLSPWKRVQLSRHPKRPHAIDYINLVFDQFEELSGDRSYIDDQSIIAGCGYIDNQKFFCIGIEKGRKTSDKIKRNFGMPNPEGYRKALRIAELASQFSIPLITFVDTPGAYPGIGAEERGQAFAIANNIEKFFGLKVPIISIIIGEGGSGGALGLAVADSVLMQEYSVYSVISPESCASILWSDTKMTEQAANALKLHPEKAKELGVIDGIISEPPGGAHRNFEKAAAVVKKEILNHYKNLSMIKTEQLLEQRSEKFRKIGNQYFK